MDKSVGQVGKFYQIFKMSGTEISKAAKGIMIMTELIKLAWERFVKKNPEAEDYRDAIKSGADASGYDYGEFYLTSGLKDVIKKSRSRTENTTIKSNSRVGKSSVNLEKLAQETINNPNTTTREKFLEEFMKEKRMI